MSSSGSAVRELYTRNIDRYSRFIAFFRSAQGMEALLQGSQLLRPGMRVLDAGSGFGMVTLALLSALREKGFDYDRIDAFDLTPAMLARFEETIVRRGIKRGIKNVRLAEADVLALDKLPSSWTNYDLILSASMLEYLPKQELTKALTALRSRLAESGTLLVVITKRSPETKLLIEGLWHAERYTKTELLEAFAQAGLGKAEFMRFSWRYFWLNRANYVVQARTTGSSNLH